MTERMKTKSAIKPDDQVKAEKVDTPVETETEDLSCPDGHPKKAWDRKSDRAKRVYISSIANSKKRTGVK